MIIRATIPLSITFFCNSEEEATPSFEFLYKQKNIKVGINSSITDISNKDLSNLIHAKFMAEIESISLEIKVPKGRGSVGREDVITWVTLITNIVNRIIACFRCFGSVSHIKPLNFSTERVLYTAESWKLEYKGDRATNFILYKQPRPKSLFRALFDSYRGSGTRHPMMTGNSLPLVIQSLEENLETEAEDELSIRATEHLANKELRLALLEATIGLEVSLSKFFRTYLSRYQPDLTAIEVNEFLQSKETLYTKIRVVLPKMIHFSYLKNIDMPKIRKAIERRNHIVHRGVLDFSNVPDIELCINELLLLTNSLNRATIQIFYSEEKDEILEALRKIDDVLSTSVWIYRSHSVSIQITLYSFPEYTSKFLLDCVSLVSSLREKRDSRFKRSEHLTVNFIKFEKGHFATWKNEKLEITQT